jgi:hypothetical protein
MLPGPAEMVEHPMYLERTQVLTSPETGIWYPQVERGHTVGPRRAVHPRCGEIVGKSLGKRRCKRLPRSTTASERVRA